METILQNPQHTTSVFIIIYDKIHHQVGLTNYCCYFIIVIWFLSDYKNYTRKYWMREEKVWEKKYENNFIQFLNIRNRNCE